MAALADGVNLCITHKCSSWPLISATYYATPWRAAPYLAGMYAALAVHSPQKVQWRHAALDVLAPVGIVIAVLNGEAGGHEISAPLPFRFFCWLGFDPDAPMRGALLAHAIASGASGRFKSGASEPSSGCSSWLSLCFGRECNSCRGSRAHAEYLCHLCVLRDRSGASRGRPHISYIMRHRSSGATTPQLAFAMSSRNSCSVPPTTHSRLPVGLFVCAPPQVLDGRFSRTAKLLESKAWTPIARVSYSAYLLQGHAFGFPCVSRVGTRFSGTRFSGRSERAIFNSRW
jgi:hypothetical protein